ncbi:MAG: GxxExxY protein [Bacteroidetes bacterium]|nr:GxxExxY protein [Bacteroidota bacterium]
MYNRIKHVEITEKVINAFYKVYNTLGYGFLEKVYENALLIELRSMGMIVEQQRRVKVFYKGLVVGDYYADLLLEEKVIIELKAYEKINEQNEFQLINYLKATGIEVGLLMNFGKKPEFKRKVYSKD